MAIKDQKVRILDTDSDNIGLNVVQLGAIGAMPVRLVDSVGAGIDSFPVSNTDIATIAGAVLGNEMQVDIVSMPAITVTASVDKTGLATETKQDDIITAIGAIPGGGGTQYTEGDTDATITGTAILHEIAANTLATISTTNPLPISDNGGTLTVDGTVAVTGTFWQATQPVSGTFWQATQPVSLAAAVAVTNADITTVAEAVSGGHMQVDVLSGGGAGEQYADGTLVNAAYKANLVAGTDGTNYQILKTDADGNVQVDVLTAPAVRALTNADVVTAELSATDNAVLDTIDTAIDAINAKLVTGTVIGDVNLGATDNAVLDTIDSVLDTINAKLVTGTDIGDVTINNSTGAAAVNIQDGGNTITVDGTVAVTNAGITTIAGAVAGTEMQCDVLTMPTITVNAHAVTNAGTFAVQVDGSALTSLQLIDDAVAADAQAYGKGILVQGDDGTDRRAILVGTDGHVQVDVLSAPSTAVTNTGTFAVQATLAAETTKVIGTVNVSASQTIGVAAGAAAIGKLLPPDIDITTHTNYARKYYTSTGAATDGIVWSPAAGKRWHVTSLYFQISADATVTFEDDKAGGDDPVLKGEYKAGSGIALTFTEKYPFASGEDAADLTVTTSAGNIYVSIVGYEI